VPTLEPSSSLRPWRPLALDEHLGDVVLNLFARYVIVEEIALDEVRCVVSEWPDVDGDGQLVFGDPEAAAEYVDPRATIERLLAERRMVRVSDELAPDADPELLARLERDLKERRVEVGDVYAIVSLPSDDQWGPPGGGGPRVGLFTSLDRLPDARIYDVSAEARSAAAAAYSAAVAGALSEEDALRFLDDEDDSEDNPGGTPAPSDPGGRPTGGGSSSPVSSVEVAVEAVASEPEQLRRQASASAGA
jgi:hypothetical protein